MPARLSGKGRLSVDKAFGSAGGKMNSGKLIWVLLHYYRISNSVISLEWGEALHKILMLREGGVQCNTESGYQLSICCRTEENYGNLEAKSESK